jgi:hypothetical protein
MEKNEWAVANSDLIELKGIPGKTYIMIVSWIVSKNYSFEVAEMPWIKIADCRAREAFPIEFSFCSCRNETSKRRNLEDRIR